MQLHNPEVTLTKHMTPMLCLGQQSGVVVDII